MVMSKWTTVRKGLKQTVKKSEELAEVAAMRVKLAKLTAQRDEQFEKLGKLTYRQLKTDDSFAEEIAAVISQIDTLGAQIIKQKAKIETAKAQKIADKANKEQEKEARKQEQEKDGQACVECVKEIIDANLSE